jgi:hypothetical protein
VLQLFRVNDPYRVLFMLVLLVAGFIPILFLDPICTYPVLHSFLVGETANTGLRLYSELFDSTAPLTAWVFQTLDFTVGRSLSARGWVALVLLFWQAAFFVRLLISNRVYPDSTYVPGLIFVILCFLSFDFFTVTPALLGSLMLLFALNHLFREIEFREQRDETIFLVGFYLGAATLFLSSYSIFFLGTIVLLVIYTRLTARKFFLLLLGFGFLHFGFATYHYYLGTLPDWWTNFYRANFTWSTTAYLAPSSLFWLALIPFSYLVFSLFLMSREARFTKYQSQLFQVMFWWMIFAAIEWMITRERTAQSFITFLPPASYFISYYLLLIRRRWIAEWMTRLLLLAVVAGFFLHRAQTWRLVDYSKLAVTAQSHFPADRKKVMVLGPQRDFYLHHQLGGGLLDYELAAPQLHAAHMESVERVARMLRINPPDAIWDPSDKLSAFFVHLPGEAARYQKQGDRYYRTNN